MARWHTKQVVACSSTEGAQAHGAVRHDESSRDPGVAPCSVLLVAFRGDRGCRSLGTDAPRRGKTTRQGRGSPIRWTSERRGRKAARCQKHRPPDLVHRPRRGGRIHVRTRCHTPRCSSPSPLGKRKTNTNPPSAHLQRNKSGNGKAPFSLLTQGPGVRASSADKPPSFLSLAAMLLVSTRVYRDAAVPNLPPFQPSQHRNTPP